MVDIFMMEPERVRQVHIHFQTIEHEVDLQTFIKSAVAVQKVANSLNSDFFEGEAEVKIVLIPPEAGSFLSTMEMRIAGAAIAFWAFVNAPVGSAFIEGMTGQSSEEWAKQIGEVLSMTGQEISHQLQIGDDDVRRQLDTLSEEFVCEITQNFLAAETDEAVSLATGLPHLSEAFDGRSELFVACIQDPDIRGLGFAPEDHFPIPRNQFPERARRPYRPEEEDQEPEWYVSNEEVFVTSPNWIKEDQGNRFWKGKDVLGRECFFTIEDNEFWNHVSKRDIRPEVLDQLRVQWAYELVGGRPKNRIVLRVLEYNRSILANPLEDAALRARLGTFFDGPERTPGPDLFEE